MGRIGYIFLLTAAILVLVVSYMAKYKKEGVVKIITSGAGVDNKVSLILGGDVMLGRSVMQSAINQKNYSYPFDKISDFTKIADVFFVNLENPVISDCPLTDSGLKFCTRAEMLSGLKNAGVNVVTLTNNHTMNYGQDGYNETKKYLSENSILAIGKEGLVMVSVNNIKLGFLGFNFTSKEPSEEDYQLIKNSDLKVDILVIGVHWGEEYKSKANDNQRKWARQMVARGADIIAGHHPHWVQDTEYINGKPVYYSLGNLVFDQTWSETTKKGMLVRLEIEGKGIIKEESFKTYMKNLGQPEIVIQ